MKICIGPIDATPEGPDIAEEVRFADIVLKNEKLRITLYKTFPT